MKRVSIGIWLLLAVAIRAENVPCPICEEGVPLLNPEDIVKLPAGYGAEEATCLQIHAAGLSGILSAATCALVGLYKSVCKCSVPAPVSAPVSAPAKTFPSAAGVATATPTAVIVFDYPSCQICGEGKIVGNRTKSISIPDGFMIKEATCYQVEKLGEFGFMDETTCSLVRAAVADPNCNCVSENSTEIASTPPAVESVCHVCGEGYHVEYPNKRITLPADFFSGSASCYQVEEVGLVGLIPSNSCRLVSFEVKRAGCSCIADQKEAGEIASDAPSDASSDAPSDSPSDVPSDIPTAPPVVKGKKAWK